MLTVIEMEGRDPETVISDDVARVWTNIEPFCEYTSKAAGSSRHSSAGSSDKPGVMTSQSSVNFPKTGLKRA